METKYIDTHLVVLRQIIDYNLFIQKSIITINRLIMVFVYYRTAEKSSESVQCAIIGHVCICVTSLQHSALYRFRRFAEAPLRTPIRKYQNFSDLTIRTASRTFYRTVNRCKLASSNI